MDTQNHNYVNIYIISRKLIKYKITRYWIKMNIANLIYEHDIIYILYKTTNNGRTNSLFIHYLSILCKRN